MEGLLYLVIGGVLVLAGVFVGAAAAGVYKPKDEKPVKKVL